MLSPYKLMRLHLLELHLPYAKVSALLSRKVFTPALVQGFVLKCHQWNLGQKRLVRLSCNCPLHLLRWPLLDGAKGSSVTFDPFAMFPAATTGDEQEDGETSGRTFLGLRGAVAFQARLWDVANLLLSPTQVGIIRKCWWCKVYFTHHLTVTIPGFIIK